HDQVVQFVGVSASAVKGDGFAAVHGVAVRIRFNEGIVAGLLDVPRNLGKRLVPGNVLPVIGARTPHDRLEQPAIIEYLVVERCALRAKRAAIDGMIGIAFHVDHLRGHVLSLVAQRMNDYAAADRTIRTGGARLRGARDFQSPRLRQYRAGIKAEQDRSSSTYGSYFEKLTSGQAHSGIPPVGL